MERASLEHLRNVILLALGPAIGCGTTEVDCTNAVPATGGLVECNNAIVRRQPQVCPITEGSECGRDADCDEDEACYCTDGPGTCVTAGCRTSVDCGSNECVRYFEATCESPAAFQCATASDKCRFDSDCPAGDGCTGELGIFSCKSACGRPFLVDGEARVAPVVRSRSWGFALRPRMPDSAEHRRVAAERWSRIGQLEHASIAAFARFTLQLLRLGAPAELVSASVAAMADETAHARLAFGLASAYAGADVGPGALPVEGSLDDCDLDSIVTTVFVEGCVGETGASALARDDAAVESDPVVRRVHQRIAADEQRHAELAWRALAWMLSVFGAPVLDAVDRELDALKDADREVMLVVVRPVLRELRASRTTLGIRQG